MGNLWNVLSDEPVPDFSELNKKRPSLDTRRLTSLVLMRSLLIEKGLFSFEDAKKVEIHRLKSGNLSFLKTSINHFHL